MRCNLKKAGNLFPIGCAELQASLTNIMTVMIWILGNFSAEHGQAGSAVIFCCTSFCGMVACGLQTFWTGDKTPCLALWTLHLYATSWRGKQICKETWSELVMCTSQALEAATEASAAAEKLEAALDVREEKLQQGWAILHAQAAMAGDSGAASLESWPHEKDLQVCCHLLRGQIVPRLYLQTE